MDLEELIRSAIFAHTWDIADHAVEVQAGRLVVCNAEFVQVEVERFLGFLRTGSGGPFRTERR
jgi:hypothetical protein